MRRYESRNNRLPGYLLLLLFFLGGAALRVLYPVPVETQLQRVPLGSRGWITAILLADAAMLTSLLAWCVLPVTTAALGTIVVGAAQDVLSHGIVNDWPQILLLLLVLPLHFLLCGWGLRTAGEIFALLRARGRSRAIIASAILLTMGTIAVCALISFSARI